MNKKICQKPTVRNPNGREGTATGYAAHLNAKETPCEECRAGKSEADRKYREANRERVLQNRRRYYDRNAESIRQKSRDWHQENKERANEYSRNYRKENPEQVKEAIRVWHQENRDWVVQYRKLLREDPSYVKKAREYSKKYYRENKHQFSEYGARRRARMANLVTDGHSGEDITREHGSICYLCETEVDLSLARGRDDSPAVDHVIPVSDPSCPGHVLENVRWSHAICNLRKGSLPIEDLALPMEPPSGSEWNVV